MANNPRNLSHGTSIRRSAAIITFMCHMNANMAHSVYNTPLFAYCGIYVEFPHPPLSTCTLPVCLLGVWVGGGGGVCGGGGGVERDQISYITKYCRSLISCVLMASPDHPSVRIRLA